jgi:hypothetical protein
MPSISFILGVALLIVASTFTISIALREPNPPGEPGRESSIEAHSDEREAGRIRSTRTPNSPFARSDSLRRNATNGENLVITAPENHPLRGELLEKASMVQTEATTELDRLTNRLELTPFQRQRLFPILARTNKNYDPALIRPGQQPGAPALAALDTQREVDEILEPRQADQLIEDTINDTLLWQEIIDKLREQLDEETPQSPENQPAQGEKPEETTPGRRGNLFERVGE